MEWYHLVTPAAAITGVIGVWAVNNYRVGQAEKKIQEEKLNVEAKISHERADRLHACAKCMEHRKEERNQEAHRYERAVSLAEHNSAMLASHIATNASEHTKIEVSAARTEEQIKALCTKMDEMNRTLQFIVRTMHREYRPQHNTETDSLERK